MRKTPLEYKLEKRQEHVVYARPERIAVNAIQIRYSGAPVSIGFFAAHQNQWGSGRGGSDLMKYVQAYLRLYHHGGKSSHYLEAFSAGKTE